MSEKVKSCQYKINEKVYVGRSVRKTGGKGTLPYLNKPFTNGFIEKFDNQGFVISHPTFPKSIWLEFSQLPLTTITIVNGVIQDELIFVEHLFRHGGTQMFIIKTDSDEYREVLDYHKEKEKSYNVLKLKELVPGNVVISAVCEAGNSMTYLGTFFVRKTGQSYRWSSHSHRDRIYETQKNL